MDQLLCLYAEVFAKIPGTMKHIRAHLTLRGSHSMGVATTLRPICYSRLGGARAGPPRRSRGASEGEPCNVSCNPVLVPKKDGTLRLCGNYKVTINLELLVDQYPLPKPVDMMACLTGGVCFSKLDFSSAYQ